MSQSISPISVIVRHEVRTLLREKTFLLLLAIFLGMTFFSVSIGWSTRTTTEGIYHAAVAYQQTHGATSVVPDPLLGISPLLVFDNMLVYLMLIGALLAIVVGHRSFIRERASGMLPLIFVRPLDRTTYVAAKLLGIALVLGGITLVTYFVSALSALLIPALQLSASEFLWLLGFYGVSFLYLVLFAAIGLFFAIVMRHESTALFMPILIWVAAVFIVPELTTGQNPVALLNPVTLTSALPDPGSFFVLMHRMFGVFSIGQFYTGSALGLLRANLTTALTPLLGLSAYVGVALGLCAYRLQRYAVTRDLYL